MTRLFALALVVLALLSPLAVPSAAASSPSLTLTPDPIVVHLGTATRVPFGTTVPVTITANGFTPDGYYFANIAGAISLRPTCAATAPVTTCAVIVPYLPAGTYQLAVRYSARYVGGLSVTARSTVIVAP